MLKEQCLHENVYFWYIRKLQKVFFWLEHSFLTGTYHPQNGKSQFLKGKKNILFIYIKHKHIHKQICNKSVVIKFHRGAIRKKKYLESLLKGGYNEKSWSNPGIEYWKIKLLYLIPQNIEDILTTLVFKLNYE